ncbi:MAG: hypothetical protein AAB038_01245 [Planctomycetota bacterium]
MQKDSQDPFHDERYIQDLVKRSQQGNRNTFDDLWTTFRFYVFNLMQIKIGGSERLDVEKSSILTNELYIKLFDKIKEYKRKEGVKFITWLRIVAVNLKKDFLKGKKDEYDKPVAGCSYSDNPGILEGDARKAKRGEDILDLVAERDATNYCKEAFAAALAELSDEERYVIISRIYEDLSWEEVSRRLRGHIGETAYYRTVIFPRALKSLRRILIQKGYEKELEDLI